MTTASLTNQTIGFIGLGVMGRPMARHLHAAGAATIIHNRSRAPVEALTAEGLLAAASPREMAERAGGGIIILCVTDTVAAEAVLFGEHGVVHGLGPGTLVIDMGTTAVVATQEFAQRIRQAGGDYVDAPVSGGQVGAESGTLSIMAGGSDAAFTRAKPVFDVLGSRVTHVGEAGAGQVAKAANQLIVALTLDGIAEAFTLANRAGVAPARIREALTGGFADSPILALHGRRMIEGNFAPGGRTAIQRKDIAQALDLARQLGLRLPATELNLTLWERMIEDGDGDLDHSAIIRLYERMLPTDT
jgi:3-hydroxyisobutyrate dehydrogenase-like beta-hydroxyacid dehydrogenase